MCNETSMENKPYDEDFNPDYFPTSAKPVFIRIGLLLALIVVLSAFLYWWTGGDDGEIESRPNPTPEAVH